MKFKTKHYYNDTHYDNTVIACMLLIPLTGTLMRN